MNDDEKNLALMKVGELICSALTHTAAQWLEVAETPGLIPAYRQTILAIAELRKGMDTAKLASANFAGSKPRETS